MLGGDTFAGKTTYLERLMENKYNENITSSTGASLSKINLEIKNFKIYFDVWDTARWVGRYETFAKFFLKECNGILILFSLCDYEYLENLNYCIKRMDEASISSLNIPVLLVGTSADREDIKVKSEDAINYAKKHNFIGYFEVSSKTGKNVYDAFEFLVYSLYQLTFERKTKIKFKIKLYKDDETEDDEKFLIDKSNYYNFLKGFENSSENIEDSEEKGKKRVGKKKHDCIIF